MANKVKDLVIPWSALTLVQNLGSGGYAAVHHGRWHVSLWALQAIQCTQRLVPFLQMSFQVLEAETDALSLSSAHRLLCLNQSTHIHSTQCLQGVDVAVKEFHTTAEAVRMETSLKNEGYIMSLLHHPNIARFYGIVLERPHFAIIMQYYPRGTLQTLLEDEEQVP